MGWGGGGLEVGWAISEDNSFIAKKLPTKSRGSGAMGKDPASKCFLGPVFYAEVRDPPDKPSTHKLKVREKFMPPPPLNRVLVRS